MRLAAIAAGILCAIATAAAIVLVRSPGSLASLAHNASTARHTAAAGGGRSAARSPGGAVGGGGVVTAGRTLRQIGIATNSIVTFERDTGAYPSVVVKYLNWGRPFPAAQIMEDHGLGATMLLVLEPKKVSLQGIVSGRENAYLKSFATADRRLGIPILLSFAPEANGYWYPWGKGHLKPAIYRAMWRRVHTVITRDGGQKITWLWQMNITTPNTVALRLLWPGKAYVNEAGIDGPMLTPKKGFSVFTATIAQIRRLTHDPILLSEVAIRQERSTPTQINGLFLGACRYGLEGVVLFDIHKEYEFDHNRAAVAIYRRAALRRCPGHVLPRLKPSDKIPGKPGKKR